MKFRKDRKLAKELLKVNNRGMNQLIATMRHINLKDTSDKNMLLIDGLIRTLNYMNSSKDLALYFNTRIKKMGKRYYFEREKYDQRVRKLKAQIDEKPAMYPPNEFMTLEGDSMRYECREDIGGTCAQGETICCGVCSKKKDCQESGLVCFFFENNLDGNYHDCDSLIIGGK